MEVHQAYRSGMQIGAALAILLGYASGAHAGSIGVGNEDYKVRWDNTIRYNLGVRAENANDAISNSPTYGPSTRKFDRGDVVTNRLDVLSEFDVIYKNAHGFRISAAGWYDNAYKDLSIVGGNGEYPGNKFNHSAERYLKGPSGELLDAFVFTKFNIGDAPVNLKVGKHTVYWGEALFSATNGINYSQGGLDFNKALASPGSQAKELFLPLNQISFNAQVADDWSVAGQYYLEWKPYRFPPGGSYLGAATFVNTQGGTFLAPGLPFDGANGPTRPDDRGDWGLKTTWSPDWLAGNMGLYYRKFGERLPWGVQVAGGRASFSYKDKTELFGYSVTTSVEGMSVGAELVYRKNTALQSKALTADGVGASGDTWHAVANVVKYFSSSPVWDGAPLTMEVNYTRLRKVNANPTLFKSADNGCVGGVDNGCATRDAWGLNVSLEPVWYQVAPGVDIKMPISYGSGLKGNSPAVAGAGKKGNGSWSVGVTAEVSSTHYITLRYADYLHEMGVANGVITSINGDANKDRGWVSLTYRTAF
jgi:hypothetical protein